MKYISILKQQKVLLKNIIIGLLFFVPIMVNGQAPTVYIQSVLNIESTTATGNGLIASIGGSSIIQHGVCWSTSSTPSLSDNHTSEGTASIGTFASPITGLVAGETYYMRAYATNSTDTAYSASEKVFTTSTFVEPTVTIDNFFSLTTNSVFIVGDLTDLGNPTPSTHGFCYSTSTNPTIANSIEDLGSASETGIMFATIEGLSEGTTYYIRAYATNTEGTAYSSELEFTTLKTPTVSTQAVTDILNYTATGNGNISDLGVPNPTQHGVCWGLTADPNLSDSYTTEGPVSATGAYTSSITGLSQGTLYHVRAYATNSAGTVYGDDVTFTTLLLPTVSTQALTDITQTTATGNGNISDLGDPDPTAYGICWNTSGTPTTADSSTDSGPTSSTGAFTGNLTGLTPGETYYVRAYATNDGGTSYGDEVSFTALKIPTVSTLGVTNITDISATGNGNISDLGVPNPSAHGVCWGLSIDPTISGSHTDEGTASATGAFTSNITGLSENTTYHIRAYATNSAGTVYGDDVTFTTPILPAVTTQAVTLIEQTSATANGTITNLGTPNLTAHGVCWNTSGTPTTADFTTNEGEAVIGSFTSSLTSLTPGTTYYVRAYATNTGGTVYGDEVSFTALDLPTVTTQEVTGINPTTATGNGTITDLGVPNQISRGVCWNTTGNPSTGDTYIDLGSTNVAAAFTVSITGLTPGVTYYVRAFATNDVGTSYGNEVSFTATKLPTVSTQAVTDITAFAATGNGDISDLGVPNPTAYGVCWSTSADPTTTDTHTDEGAVSATGAFTSSITGLSENTTYHVRAYATNDAGTVYGDDVTFSTLLLPTISTEAVTLIEQTTATGNGTISGLGIPNPTAHGICWNTSGTPTTGDSSTDEGAISTTGTFTSSLTSLSPGTTYYVRAYATNDGGTAYGNEVSFTTLNTPTVTTQELSDITQTTATGNGNISDLGNPNPTAYGICWNTTGNPEISDFVNDLGAASSTGAFTAGITSLTPGTEYFVRAFATNTQGTVYGDEVSFTAHEEPSVTTQGITDITDITATGNGNITNLGVPNPTAYGVCWSESLDPTIADSFTDEGEAFAPGAFTSSIEGLSENTLYHVRAYVTNTEGTFYGDDVTFTTYGLPTVSTQEVSDIDQTTATGNGNITHLGTPNPTAYGVCWNTTGTPTIADDISDNGAASVIGAFTASMTGLTPGTLYYVRAFATNDGGTVYGDEVSFTSPRVATITTQPVDPISKDAATASGNISDLGIPNPTEHGFCWNTSGTPTLDDDKNELGAASATGAFTASMTGLTPGTLYYVRAFATNDAGTVYGNEVSFTTLKRPTVTTQNASDITQTSATGNGTITDLGVHNPIRHGICWSTTGIPTTGDSNINLGSASSAYSYTVGMTSLTPGTKYFVRAFATNDGGTNYGDTVSFTTESVDATWAGNSSTDWATAANWSPSGVPASGDDIFIPDDVSNDPIISSTTNVSCNNLFIQGSAILTIESDASSTGSLIVSGTNTGNVEMQRYMTGSAWHILSSAVSGNSISDFNTSNGIDTYNGDIALGVYNEGTNSWSMYPDNASALLAAGNILTAKGYLSGRPTSGTLSFSGSLNVGSQSINITSISDTTGWNAVGNPYSSSINVTSLISTNTDLLDDSYESIYLFNGTNYTIATSGYVQPGQGFLVNTDVGGSFDFTSTMQSHQSPTFYKKATQDEEYAEIKLLAASDGITDETLIRLYDNQTYGLNPGKDIGKYMGGGINFILHNQLLEDNGIDFAIQALPKDSIDKISIPIGLTYSDGGSVTFSSELADLPTEARVILEDRLLDKFIDLELASASYTIDIPEGTSGYGRFFLHTYDMNAVGTELNDLKKFTIFANNKIVYINGRIDEFGLASVYDMMGKELKQVELFPGNTNTISLQELNEGIYIIRLKNGDDIYSEKVLLK